MLANDELRTVLVSIHVPARSAGRCHLSTTCCQTLRITDQSLRRLLGQRAAHRGGRSEPHAGRAGCSGARDLDVIAPAVAAARGAGLEATDRSPRTRCSCARAPQRRDGEFDVVVAMYHDQGLIPVKYLGLDQGVNVTLGLPLVRTSPDHGTAFDLAGTRPGRPVQPGGGAAHGAAPGGR